jgi:hypothetical protein
LEIADLRLAGNMIDVRLIVCDAIVGLPRVPVERMRPDVDDLLGEMARLRIDAAVVRHRACIDNAPYFGNQALMEDIAGRSNLIPAWVLTPDGGEPAFDVDATVREMLQAGVKIAWMIPKEHLFSVQPWCAGRLYGALQAARVPLLVEYDQFSADDVHEICAAFPTLRLVLLNVPRLGRNRMLYPLLEQHENIHVCFGPLFSMHEGFADLCQRFGIQRWVLGSGYPNAEGGAAISGLMYAGLPDEALQAVAHGNMERLLAEAGASGKYASA